MIVCMTTTFSTEQKIIFHKGGWIYQQLIYISQFPSLLDPLHSNLTTCGSQRPGIFRKTIFLGIFECSLAKDYVGLNDKSWIIPLLYQTG